MESKQKLTWGEVYNAYPNVHSKLINNEKNFNLSWSDHIAEQILLVITRVCKESMNSSQITAVKCLIYLFI